MLGRLLCRARVSQSEDNVSATDAAEDRALDVEIEVDRAEMEKLTGFVEGVPVLIEATVVRPPAGEVAASSFPAFQLGQLMFGLTAITNPPPERGTTTVRLAPRQRISLRITH